MGDFVKNGNRWLNARNYYLKGNGVWSTISESEFQTRISSSVFFTEVIDGRPKTLEIQGPSSISGESLSVVVIYCKTDNVTEQANLTISNGSEYAQINNNGHITILSEAITGGTITISAAYDSLTVEKTIDIWYKSGASSSTQTNTIVDESGNTSTITTTTTDNGDGSYSSTQIVVTQDESGNITGSSEKETTTNADGSSNSTTTNYDANGNETGHVTASGDTEGNTRTQTVEKDEDGNDVVTGYDISTNDDTGMMKSEEFIETGFIPFDGSSDWELNFKFRWDWARNTEEKSTTTSVLSCAEFVGGQLKSGFVLRFYAAKATSSTTTPKTRPQLQVSVGDTSTTKLLFVTGNSGRVYTNPVTYDVHIVKTGSTMNFEIQAIGSLKYNPTKDKTSASQGCTTTQNEIVTYSWSDNSTSTVDITVGGYLNSQGVLDQKSDIDVYEFNVRKI